MICISCIWRSPWPHTSSAHVPVSVAAWDYDKYLDLTAWFVLDDSYSGRSFAQFYAATIVVHVHDYGK